MIKEIPQPNHLRLEPTIISGPGNMPAAVIYSFFGHSYEPEAQVTYSRVNPIDASALPEQFAHIAPVIFKESPSLDKQANETGLSVWIEAEKHFFEAFPNTILYTQTPSEWTTSHLQDVWTALQKSGHTITVLWSGLEGAIPSWIWSATR